MGNWGKPGAIFIYCLFASAVIYIITPSETIDKGLYKIYDKAVSYRNNEDDSIFGNTGRGSATKRHKKHKNKKKSYKKR